MFARQTAQGAQGRGRARTSNGQRGPSMIFRGPTAPDGNDDKDEDQYMSTNTSCVPAAARKQTKHHMKAQPKSGTASPLLIYGRRKPLCKYSEDLVLAAAAKGFDITVIDVDKDVEPNPDWLTGTPTIVTDEGEAYCGDAAFSWVMLHDDNNQTEQQPIVEEDEDIETSEPYSFLTKQKADEQQPDNASGCCLKDAFAESAKLADLVDAVGSAPTMSANASLELMMKSRK